METNKYVENVLNRLNLNSDEKKEALDYIFNDEPIYTGIYKGDTEYFRDYPYLRSGIQIGSKKKLNYRVIIPDNEFKELDYLKKDDYNLIGNNSIFYNLKIYLLERLTTHKIYKTLDDYLIPNTEVAYTCPRCKSPLITFSEQTRASDEPSTVMYRCTTNPGHLFTPDEIELKNT
jgi:DNA-directed RNA polymerase subunit M/transcription elongation factor TFIIS